MREKRPFPAPPSVGGAGEPPIPRPRLPQPEQIEYVREPLRDTHLYQGRNWPIVGAIAATLPVGSYQEYRVSREVAVKLHVQVMDSGTLDIYVRDQAGAVGGTIGSGTPQFRIISHPLPYIIALPPGNHSFFLYANTAVTFAITPLEEVGR